MAFFGNNQFAGPAAGSFAGLPEAPPMAGKGGSTLTQQLPPAPPMKKKASAFDDDNYQQTMLALAAGFFGSQNFGDGLGNAATAIYNQNERLRQQALPQLGGPDDAFEVYTDPQTGERTYKPVQQFVDYQQGKRVKPKDVADMNGRAMYAISQMGSPEEQAAAFAEIRANPELYGVDVDTLPTSWNPTYGNIVGNMGMTVSQAMTRKQAAENEDNREGHRNAADQDRAARTGIYRDRAQAATSQGAERISIAREALAKRGAGGGGRSGGGGKKGKAPISTMSTSELLSIALGN